MHYYTHILENGLRIIHLPVDSPVCYCGFAVNVGARDELKHEYGMAHFVEHLLFKGTEKRKAWHILNRMENVGGELNAYTTKEDTFIYSIFLEEHFNRAVELLTDILFYSSFPPIEVEKEKEVILDEINSYKDSPAEIIYDEFENILFSGHSLGHNILGEEKTLLKFNSESGRTFMDRYYTPGNMIFFSMGRIAFPKIKRIVEKMTGKISSLTPSFTRQAPLASQPRHIRESLDTHQAHVLIGGASYSLYDDKRIPLFLLNNMLGGPGMNNRLNLLLREKHGLVYNVDSSITSYTDTGMMNIYFGTDPKHLDKAVQLVYRELKKIRDIRLTTSQLTAAKKQLIGQLGVAGDNRESQFLGLGKSFLRYNRYDTLPEVFSKLEIVTAKDIQEVANEVLGEHNLSSLIYE